MARCSRRLTWHVRSFGTVHVHGVHGPREFGSDGKLCTVQWISNWHVTWRDIGPKWFIAAVLYTWDSHPGLRWHQVVAPIDQVRWPLACRICSPGKWYVTGQKSSWVWSWSLERGKRFGPDSTGPGLFHDHLSLSSIRSYSQVQQGRGLCVFKHDELWVMSYEFKQKQTTK